MQISPQVLSVLSNATIGALSVTLPPGQLDRTLYEGVDKVLRAMGGKWNRRTKTHEFTSEHPADAMDRALATGSVIDKKQELGAFYTPGDLAASVVVVADIQDGMDVLEPSAGGGALALAAQRAGGVVDACEIDPVSGSLLQEGPYREVNVVDFLKTDPNPQYDRVVMNPPFAKKADIDHVLHAAKFLKPGGRLVAIMSGGVQFRSDRKTTDFLKFVDAHNGTIQHLPAESFKASGTGVSTVLVTIEAPR